MRGLDQGSTLTHMILFGTTARGRALEVGTAE
jgi:hypothetical protein